MDKEQMKNKVFEVVDKKQTGVLATVKKNKPHSRYMTFFHDELTFYTPTSIETHKADEIQDNPNVHVLVGYDGEGYNDPYLEIEGTATIRDDQGLKEKFWNDQMKHYFEGPNDPNYILLEIKPSLIRLMNDSEHEPQTLEL
ncbi:pyridoxamine 5'-phosphate oxidase family protein [Fictibacillus norfolkensis]|jgi:general stress protein 26|uniref:Pyridoxamine 5'-phosphate oxidase family protein n=1 Tax=Fictibacillus norfolkensis TaxID=2762233 RepID=A0ABR8SRH0_9BACL|nr:pyridoxamine 5'-phosphate oxidase family protein [Fictibacillus norfolkensis]MBD7965959.1 pyridoxamine 5'-phosphate oxidase family protein [Fictibacillus norfolkensis]